MIEGGIERMSRMDKKFWQGVLSGVLGTLLISLLVLGIGNIAFGGISVVTGANTQALGENTSAVLSKMNLLKGYMEQYFMEEVDTDKLDEGVYKGMFESLEDPYSCYYTKEEYDELKEESSGKYCGIGATITQDPETGMVYIVNAFEGGAAYEAGIETGDIIYKVDGKDMTGKELSEVVSCTKGEEGTTVKIKFYLSKKKKYKTFTMERRQIEVPTVEYEMKENQIGYVAVLAFDEPTDEQFIAALKDLQKRGMKGLVVDLRNNGGGMLDTVVNMLDYMLPKGKVIVSTKDKNGQGAVYKAKSANEFTMPLVVLINGNTASASEVFSGAIQDYNIGTLVGTTSFGKGIVQSVIPLKDGTAIKLTTSKYYTPKDRNIHKKGIEPDIEVELDTEAKKDNQLDEALHIVKQKIERESK